MMPYKLIILLTIYSTVTSAVLTNHPNVTDKKCKTQDCKFLYNNFVKYLNVSNNLCQDIYSFTCNDDNIFSTEKEDFSKKYSEMLNEVKRLLTDEIPNSLTSAMIEQVLYKNCLTLGKAENDAAKNELNKKYKSLKEIIADAANNVKWQKVDRALYNEGFGHAFFDIKVVRNPEKSEKNIILIEPSPMTLLFNAYEMLKTTIQEKIIREYNKPHNDDTAFIYQFMKLKGEPAMDFLRLLVELVYNSATRYYKNNQSKKTTIHKWHREYNEHYNKTETDINWTGLIFEAFQEVGIKIEDNESIIVKNQPYFSELRKLLHDTPNDIIAVAIATKALMQNLRYIDWNFAQEIKYVEKEAFCFYETKLYGVSYRAFQVLYGNNKDIYSGNNLQDKLLLTVVYNVISSLKQGIYDAETLSYREESYLLAELDEITINVGNNIWSSNVISDYYGEYYVNLDDNYFSNINNYQKMLKNKEFATLKHYSSPSLKYLPFSVVELANPANRFIMHIYFNSKALNQYWLPKQVHYGNYGVKIASFLYALLNENKLQNVVHQYSKASKAYPDYISDNFECFFSSIYRENVNIKNEKEALEIISNFYGLQIAYNAMVEFDTNEIDVPLEWLQMEELNEINQFFFLVYVKFHCGLDKNAVNNVLLHNAQFYKEFPRCISQMQTAHNKKCELKLFEMINKHAYLIKL